MNRLGLIDWIKFYKYDVVNSLGLVLMLGVFYFLFVKSPIILRNFQSKNYTETTNGTIIKIEERNWIRQTRMGNKSETYGWSISWKYKLKDTVYSNSNFIHIKELEKGEIDKVKNYKTGSDIKLRYKTEDKSKSYLIFQ